MTQAALGDFPVQVDSGGRVNILGGENIGYFDKKVHMNGYRDRAF